MPDRQLTFHILGPLAVRREGDDVALGGPRQRAVLAHLILRAGSVVPAETLVDAIWGDDPPSTGTGPLRTYVSQLRQLLWTGEPGGTTSAVVRRPPGYVLDVSASQVDASRFETLFADARAAVASGAPTRALARLAEALALWRGPALGDLAAAQAFEPDAVRLDQLRLAAEELRAELLLATGRHVDAAADLVTLARANVTRERLWALLMTAQYRSGRQADALRTYQEAREALVEGMGIEPGPELRELEWSILRQDPGLDWRPGAEPLVPGGPPRAAEPDRTAAGAGLHNLPRQLTSFLGRQAERAAVGEALSGSRLVTLCGPAGCGKTRLAIRVGEELVDRFPAGVWFVDLSAVTEPGLVPRAMGAALGAETDQPRPLDHLCRTIGDDEMLVVLDNCEHVVEATAEATETVLERCPSARILATSREDLQVSSERVLRIGALGLPDAGTIGVDRDAILRSEAVQLFLERGRAALAGFAPTGETLDGVAQICTRLDGIPLAIELAAALVGSLPIGEIDARLDDRFRLLGPARRRATPRHRTLRAALDWSFDLLDGPERELFVRLGVFLGDFTLAAAEAVADLADDPMAVVRGLSHLVTKSMVGCVSTRDGADRYRLLDTMRHYALEQLGRDEEAPEVHARHARYYARFVVEAERHVHGPAASEWLGRVVSELPNLRAAVGWAFSTGDLETALRMAGSLSWFFARMGLLDEAARWLDEGMRRRDELPDELCLRAMTAAGTVSFMRGDFSRTHAEGEECVRIARKVGDPRQLAIALIVRGGNAVYEGDLAAAEECFPEAASLCDMLGDRWGQAWMLTVWAAGSRRAGRHDVARRQLEQSLAIFRDLGDDHGQVVPLVNLAVIAQDEGDLDEAQGWAREAARIAVRLADRQLQHTSMCVLGRIEQGLGERERARELLLRSVTDFPGAHHRMMLAIAFEGLAGLAGEAGDHAAAAGLLGFTGALRERWQIGVSGPRSRELEGWLAAAAQALGAERVRLEQSHGRQLDLDQAVTLATEATSALADGSATTDLIASAR
jgi:predicted ATPase/DNA-binding SARP family transcriptional activator